MVLCENLTFSPTSFSLDKTLKIDLTHLYLEFLIAIFKGILIHLKILILAFTPHRVIPNLLF